jgi:hypothetical protein
MKILFKAKDGGKESNVTGYWLIESKSLFSIVLLCFDRGSREAFHNHAFNAVSWILSGQLLEELKDGRFYNYTSSIIPIFTSRERMHRVFGKANKTWALSFRGPWNKTWKEFLPNKDKEITLTNGRVEV